MPGTYVNYQVLTQPTGVSSSGIAVIMGEANGGPSYDQIDISKNFFSPDQLQQVTQIYTSGQIVDAFTALTTPSNDPNISGTANLIYILKTNTGTIDTSTLLNATSATYGVLSDINQGVLGNQDKYQVLAVDSEIAPAVQGTTVPAFGSALDGDTFSIRLNGGAVSVVTLSSGSSAPVSPAESAAAQSAAQSAYTSLAARTFTTIPNVLDGQSLTAGNYTFASGDVNLAQSGAGALTLTGSATDVFVFKTPSTLTTGAGGIPTITLAGGALAKNVYWVVGSSATINSGFAGTFQGNVIAQTSITDTLGGTVNGSLNALSGAITLSAAALVNAQNAPLMNYAGSFGLLGASGITNTGASVITGNVGSSPTNTIVPGGWTIVGAAHSNIAELVTELNLLLPAGIVASAGTATNSIALTMAADSDAWNNGWGKSFELIDSTPGDLAALGLVAGLNVSSQEPSIEIQDSNLTRGVSETLSVAADVALMVGYQGTSGTLTINQAAGTLTTTVTGGSGGNLSINLTHYSTIGTLAGFIASQPGYSATVVSAANQLPTSALDDVSAIGIASSTPGDEPGRIKDSLAAFEQALSTSRLMTFVATATAGLPAPMASPAYLSGGARGATLAADIVNSVNDLSSITCNIIVPLMSQNASADIAAGQTDPGSTYTIAAIDALLKSHCLEMSDPSLDRNRMAILSNNGTYAQAAQIAQTLATFRCSLAFQNVTQVNSAGVITQFQPWYAACIAMGMQLGGFYKSICNKNANVISVIDPSDYNSGDPGDTSEALSAGLLPLWTDVGGPKWVSDQTTYQTDSNFIFNSIQAVYDADIITIDLKSSFTNAFVGQSLADVSAASASAFLSQKMASYMQLKLIAPSNGAPLGFNNAKITIAAPTMSVSVNIFEATALYFVSIGFTISAVQQSA